MLDFDSIQLTNYQNLAWTFLISLNHGSGENSLYIYKYINKSGEWVQKMTLWHRRWWRHSFAAPRFQSYNLIICSNWHFETCRFTVKRQRYISLFRRDIIFHPAFFSIIIFCIKNNFWLFLLLFMYFLKYINELLFIKCLQILCYLFFIKGVSVPNQ